MDFIKTIKDKQLNKQQTDAHRQAEEIITLSDFDDTVFIAYGGMPILAVEDGWTSKDIINQLNIVRQNYINAKLKRTC